LLSVTIKPGLAMREVGVHRGREHGKDAQPHALLHAVVKTLGRLDHRGWCTTRQLAPNRIAHTAPKGELGGRLGA
jgi:hypothetical protein